ncbi:MAG: glycine cleavage system aminomethyltransferase GcvT [Albidovulum sp.]|nr:glycine cleavage system aminomethyltransferase GcvT [Albidovulum sp.]MDE0530209.1 glycine cleavage system aminomethyltransferase GcvT [Albidovulum sp.]
MEPGKTTELFQFHLRHGGKIVEFAGYRLPVNYRPGILNEHLTTRIFSGLFDVSHMGQFLIRPRNCNMNEVALSLESTLPSDLVSLPVGRQRYSVLTSDAGGIIDDLIITRKRESFLLVANAARKDAVSDHLNSSLQDSCIVEPVENRSLIALQGPGAEAAIGRIAPGAPKLRFMEACEMSIAGIECWISRSGYTGEDGFELSLPAGAVEDLAERLLDDGGVLPVGLGARDSLRLEAGLCLYGSDICLETSPVEAGLKWTIAKSRRRDGIRSGGFPGSERILEELESGPARIRVGIRPEGPVPMRRGTKLFGDSSCEIPIGSVTSGGFGPSLNGPLSMGYVSTAFAAKGTLIFGAVRKRLLPAKVVSLPFIETHYKKN